MCDLTSSVCRCSLRDDERAKLNVTLAYTLNSLYYMFLRTKVGLPRGSWVGGLLVCGFLCRLVRLCDTYENVTRFCVR